MQTQVDLFLESLQMFWGQIALFLPKFLAALVLLGLGWLVARTLRVGVKRLLDAFGFGRMAERSGLEAWLRQGGVEVSLASIMAGLAFWMVILIVTVSAANSLGLDAVASLVNRITLYLPNVLVAILILVFGTLLARVLNRSIFAWLNGLKAPNALLFSTTAEYAVQIFVVFMTLEQLAIGTQMLTLAFSLGFGGVMLALALAFGLGGRDWAAKQIEKALSQKPNT